MKIIRIFFFVLYPYGHKNAHEKHTDESALHHMSVRLMTKTERQVIKSQKTAPAWEKKNEELATLQTYLQDISSICFTSISPEEGGGMWKGKHRPREVRSEVQEYQMGSTLER